MWVYVKTPVDQFLLGQGFSVLSLGLTDLGPCMSMEHSDVRREVGELVEPGAVTSNEPQIVFTNRAALESFQKCLTKAFELMDNFEAQKNESKEIPAASSVGNVEDKGSTNG